MISYVGYLGGKQAFCVTASGVNPRAPEAGYLALGRDLTPGICLLGPPLPAPAKWKTKRSTLARILKDLLPPDGWDYWAVGSGGASSGLKLETAQRPLASMPSWLELVPAGQQSIPLVSVAGVREKQLSLDPIPPSFSSPGKTQPGLWAQRR